MDRWFTDAEVSDADPETGIITAEKLARACGIENSGTAAAEQPPATGEDDDGGAGAAR